MSVVYYRFKANLRTNSLPLDGQSITVRDLKSAIQNRCEHYLSNFDLSLEDTAGKTYTNDEEHINANSSIIIRRVPCIDFKQRTKMSHNESGQEKQNNIEFTTESTGDDLSDINVTTGSPDAFDDLGCGQFGEQSSDNLNSSSLLEPISPISRVILETNICEEDSNHASVSNAMSLKCNLNSTSVDDHDDDDKAGDGDDRGDGGTGDAIAFEEQKHVNEPITESVPVGRQPPDELVCTICHNLLSDAVSMLCCNTSYCNFCVSNTIFISENESTSSESTLYNCPNCQTVLTDYESSIFENTCLRSRVRDWLSIDSDLLSKSGQSVNLQTLSRLNEPDKMFVNNRRVLKPKHSLLSAGMSTSQSADGHNCSSTNSDQHNGTGNTNNSTAAGAHTDDLYDAQMKASLAEYLTTGVINPGFAATLQSLPRLISNNVNNNNNTNNGDNFSANLLNALYQMHFNNLHNNMYTIPAVCDMSPDAMLTAASLQSALLLNPVLQLAATSPHLYDSDFALRMHDPDFMLSKDEFYHLKMKMLHSERRRHRHHSRSRSPIHLSRRSSRLHSESPHHRSSRGRDSKERLTHSRSREPDSDHRSRHERDKPSHDPKRRKNIPPRYQYRPTYRRDFMFGSRYDHSRRRARSRSSGRSPRRFDKRPAGSNRQSHSPTMKCPYRIREPQLCESRSSMGRESSVEEKKTDINPTDLLCNTHSLDEKNNSWCANNDNNNNNNNDNATGDDDDDNCNSLITNLSYIPQQQSCDQQCLKIDAKPETLPAD